MAIMVLCQRFVEEDSTAAGRHLTDVCVPACRRMCWARSLWLTLHCGLTWQLQAAATACRTR